MGLQKKRAKLVKVTLEFEDEIRTLEGEEAEEYDQFLVNCQIFCLHHAGAPRLTKMFNWVCEPKTDQ